MNDRRISRVKEAMDDAFISLVLEKGFDAVRVSDIVNMADINRVTFYLHYLDKYDLLEQMKNETIADLKDCLCSVEQKEYDGYNETIMSSCYQMFLLYLRYMRKYEKKMRALLSIEGKSTFRHRMLMLLQENLREGLYPHSKAGHLPVPEPYWITYIFNADIGVIEYWLEGGCKESEEEIANILLTMLSVETLYFDNSK